MFFGIAMTEVVSIGSDLGPFHYFSPRRGLSNGLSSDPKIDHMQNLRPWEVGIPTYHFRAYKTVGVSSSRVLFRVYSPLCFILETSLASL